MTTRMAGAVPDARTPSVHWRGVISFVLLSYALMWLATVPFWLSPRGLAMPGASLILLAVMFAPTISSVLVCRLVERRPWAAAVALRSRTPVSKIVRYCLLALLLVPLGLAASTALAVALGWQRIDLTKLSGFAAVQRIQPATLSALPIAVFVAIQLGSVILQIVTIGAVSALGEEIGWRGYLLGALLPLGRARALLITGLVWAFWHLPLILLGYEYPRADRGLAIVAFAVSVSVFGAVLGWLRLRSGSVLPGAFGHAALNGWAGEVLLLFVGGRPVHVLLGAPQGLTMIICFGVMVPVLFRCARPPAPRP